VDSHHNRRHIQWRPTSRGKHRCTETLRTSGVDGRASWSYSGTGLAGSTSWQTFRKNLQLCVKGNDRRLSYDNSCARGLMQLAKGGIISTSQVGDTTPGRMELLVANAKLVHNGEPIAQSWRRPPSSRCLVVVGGLSGSGRSSLKHPCGRTFGRRGSS
jgi:hypothetical protein